MKDLKKWITTALLSLLLLPAMAQQKANTAYTFRFVTDKDMFYVPWSGNGEELNRLLSCVEQYKGAILDGEIPVEVNGYCTSQATDAENLAMAKTRSNRVKTEMILRGGLTEACFRTRNHAAAGNYVTVRIVIPARAPEAEPEARPAADAERQEAERRAEEQRKAEEARLAAERAEAERLAAGQQAAVETAPAAAVPSETDRRSGWYAGLQGGVPFGVSQFSSFGADKTRAGWNIGIHGGYRFNPVLSVEAQAAWGQVNLSARDCCPDYWLGSDAVRYEAAVAGMTGWNYSALRSRTCTQSYGVQLNVNLLGFFRATRESRWMLELAPRLAATGTNASLRTIEGGNEALTGDTRWHLGAGGNLQAAYRVADCLNLGIYTGISYLTGNPLDGMPEHLHRSNYIWESGIRLSWLFRNTRKEASK